MSLEAYRWWRVAPTYLLVGRKPPVIEGHNVLTNEIMYAGNPIKEYDIDLGYMPDFAGDILGILLPRT